MALKVALLSALRYSWQYAHQTVLVFFLETSDANKMEEMEHEQL